VHLGCEDHVVAPAAGQRLADDLLGLAAAIDVGRVDEIDAGVERSVDDPDALVVIGVAGRVGSRSKHHRAEAERTYLHSCASKRSIVHGLAL
jgi:hypothetical protein